MKLPQFVFLKRTDGTKCCLRLSISEAGQYYRDAGDWSVNAKFEGGKIITFDTYPSHLNGKELFECSYDVWKKCNGSDAPAEIKNVSQSTKKGVSRSAKKKKAISVSCNCVNHDDYWVLMSLNPPTIYLDSERQKLTRLVRKGLTFCGNRQAQLKNMREMGNFLLKLANKFEILIPEMDKKDVDAELRNKEIREGKKPAGAH